MQWRHLNVFNKECVIVCALPRGRRGDAGKVYRVTPPWEGRSKHFTQEFEAFAVTLMREMRVKRAGQILGESDTRMWRMLFAHVKAAHARLSFASSLRPVRTPRFGRLLLRNCCDTTAIPRRSSMWLST
jgi:transposase